MAGLLLFVHEEVVATLDWPRNVNVLSQLDIAVRAEDEEAAIAPGAQALRSEPVQPHIAEVALPRSIMSPKSWNGVVLVADVAPPAMPTTLRLRGPGIEQELIDLVRADVAQNAAVLLRVPEPIGASAPPPASPLFLEDLVRCDVEVWMTLPMAMTCTSSAKP